VIVHGRVVGQDPDLRIRSEICRCRHGRYLTKQAVPRTAL
jgi:hypothetical protein